MIDDAVDALVRDARMLLILPGPGGCGIHTKTIWPALGHSHVCCPAEFGAYGRVEARHHHPQDVAIGAGIVIASSFLFARPFVGFNVQPTVGKKSAGVTFSMEF